MNTEERIDAIAKTLEQVSGVLAQLAGTVAAHDRQIDALFKLTERNDAQIARTEALVADLGRQLEAYLTRIPPQ